jgi:hypothetical protein
MRLQNRRSIASLLALSAAVLFLTAACAGPAGETGAKGATGATGASGAAGATGATGAAGAVLGLGASIVLAPAGEAASGQPVTLESSNSQPNVVIFGAGFPADEFLSIYMDYQGVTVFLTRRSGDQFPSADGTFQTEVRPSTAGKRFTPEPGLYTITAVSESGARASAPVLITEATE